jgi:hypothetical protein
MDQRPHAGRVPLSEAEIYLYRLALHLSCLAHAVEKAFSGRARTCLGATGDKNNAGQPRWRLGPRRNCDHRN